MARGGTRLTLLGGLRPPAQFLSAAGARSAGFQPASGQDGRSPRKREGERSEAGAAGPVPGGSRHNMHHTSWEGCRVAAGWVLPSPVGRVSRRRNPTSRTCRITLR